MSNYDEYLLDRLRQAIKTHNVEWYEKKMFGGMCFMVDDKMCLGTYQGGLMARVNPTEVDELTKREAAEQMIHGGKPMTGYLMIQPDGYDLDEDLEFWVAKCIDFNPLAKASKKKSKNK